MVDEYLVAIRTMNFYFQVGTSSSEPAGQYVTSIYDHMQFIEQFLPKYECRCAITK